MNSLKEPAKVELGRRARSLRSMHDKGSLLVLANAWDVGSAVVLVHAGALAIATTSAGVAWSLGRPDGQQVTREEMVDVVRRVAAAVDVPVTADIEGGYGPDPADVARTVQAVAEVGAVGVNLEDSRAGDGLFGLTEQAYRLSAARDAASAAGVPDLVVNARTDVYLHQVGAAEGRFDEVLRRAGSYAEAGADCLFVPGLLDLSTLRELVEAAPLPISVMAWHGGPTVAELGATGVRRISVGTAHAQAAYTAAHRAAVELFTEGTYSASADSISVRELNSWFPPAG